ncbi:PQQ-dependent sugar dehydrogenase [Sulfuriroseicoccus oceanibius]|uniref:PQQ-dependent sugar dehydrogenase n=1 Tax=Sulfuriroseicoccus oceanibius TaxID=2707525 RepID=A0A6B3L3B6_9BACT|nr:PQQ-dependent sugar dehydrogenase [Sulfuriroseicoccus oceanibius]QQL45934.1 PQQ-dependent sugar dehydrogenase [Sulfuriroseicoccus oceanibius]
MKKLALVLLAAASVAAAHAGVKIEPIAQGFDKPLWVGCPEGENDHLWVLEQAGMIHIFDKATGKRREQPFLDLTSMTKISANERGLLGLAFAPDFQTSGRFYINLTNNRGNTEIIRFTTKDDNRYLGDIESAEVLMRVNQDFGNHNGGFVGFGPDGMLYVGMGDGGSANDPKNRAQDMGSQLGKMLRIDVSHPKSYSIPADNPFGDTIWMTGLRNPWRCSWDRETKDLYIGDVGQNKLEEINFVPAGKGRGANFGWRLREGTIATPKRGVGGPLEGAMDPIYEYPHNRSETGGFSVTGGEVYRGPDQKLNGRYFFADYQFPRLWSFVAKGQKATDFQIHNEALKSAEPRVKMISSFGSDNTGRLFFTDHATGAVHEIVAE